MDLVQVLTLAIFYGLGFWRVRSGSSAGDTIGADVNSDNYGGIVALTIPLGGANAEI